jgi:F-box/WD-40 domain protein MET30
MDRAPSIFGESSPQQQQQHQHHPSRDNCDRRRPQDEDGSRLVRMPSGLAGKTVSPFLKEHIPGLYAPIGKGRSDSTSTSSTSNALSAVPAPKRDPNSRYCYRHRPDSKCRRAADESKMGAIQRVRPDPRPRLSCLSARRR